MITEKILIFTTQTGMSANGEFGGRFYLFFSGALQMVLAEQSLLFNVLGYFLLIFLVFVSFVLPLLILAPMILNWRKNSRVLRHGEPARAKILKIRDTGATVNDNPQVGMLLAVYPEKNLASFQAETIKVISRLEIPKIQTGEMLDVKYNPQKPSEVAFVL